jgi:hypothetical protein
MRCHQLENIINNTIVTCQLSDIQYSPFKRIRLSEGGASSSSIERSGAVRGQFHTPLNGGSASSSSANIDIIAASAAADLTDIVSSSSLQLITNMAIDDLRSELGLEEEEGFVRRVDLQKMTTAFRHNGDVPPCTWRGPYEKLGQHLKTSCRSTTQPCELVGCHETPLIKNATAHAITCGGRDVVCRHCRGTYKAVAFSTHLLQCAQMLVECPSVGCNVQRRRGVMNLHIRRCDFFDMPCPYPPCDQRRRRMDMGEHLSGVHRGEHILARDQIAEMQRRLDTFESTQLLQSEHSMFKAFNWLCSSGFDISSNETPRHGFGNNWYATAVLRAGNNNNPIDQDSLFFGISLDIPVAVDEDPQLTKFVLVLSIIDSGGAVLHEIDRFGTWVSPHAHDFNTDVYFGTHFRPSDEIKALCLRPDGSIRAHVTLQICPDE